MKIQLLEERNSFLEGNNSLSKKANKIFSLDSMKDFEITDLEFEKYHGLGNDYIIINNLDFYFIFLNY